MGDVVRPEFVPRRGEGLAVLDDQGTRESRSRSSRFRPRRRRNSCAAGPAGHRPGRRGGVPRARSGEVRRGPGTPAGPVRARREGPVGLGAGGRREPGPASASGAVPTRPAIVTIPHQPAGKTTEPGATSARASSTGAKRAPGPARCSQCRRTTSTRAESTGPSCPRRRPAADHGDHVSRPVQDRNGTCRSGRRGGHRVRSVRPRPGPHGPVVRALLRARTRRPVHGPPADPPHRRPTAARAARLQAVALGRVLGDLRSGRSGSSSRSCSSRSPRSSSGQAASSASRPGSSWPCPGRCATSGARSASVAEG